MPRLPATLCLIVCLHMAARGQTFEDTLGLRTEWITLDEAVGRVLENSLDVRIERLNWAVSERQTEAAWAKFDPAWFMNSTWRDASLPQNTLDFVQTGGGFVVLDEPNIFRQQSLLSQAGFEGLLPTGTQYRLFAGAGEFRNDLNRQRPPAIFYPEYAAAVGGTITQPLLRGFGLGVNLAEVRVGRKNQEIALRQWEARLQRSVAQVVADYFDLIFAVEDLEVKRGVTAFARRLVLENEKRLEAGQLSPADVQEAEVAVAVSREEVIAALGFAVEKQRSLKTQILGSMREGEGVVFLPRDSLPVIAPRTERAPLLA
ncbi:MAG TPA: TolC family protein, partial [Prosthecobacter sp.]|nr:TolC family protein [Prosthecobacter sp.]